MEIDGIGYAAATMTTVSFVPQLLRVIRLRSARDISLGMFLIFSAGTFAWLVYGIMVHSAPVWVANALTFVLSMTILVLKLRFDRHATHPKQPAGAPR
ncbi:MAG: SemiSWEET transporter [Acidobacteria bacterium]|nr:SemiSWEET transporter [Acidobacteriota bacterium]